MAQIDLLKIRITGATDGLLTQLLADAQAEILDFTNRNVLPTKLEGLQRELAIVYYNRMGAEGLTAHSEGSISDSYSTEIPDNLKSRLIAHRLLKGAAVANATTL